MKKTIRNIVLILCMAIMIAVLAACAGGGSPADNVAQTHPPAYNAPETPAEVPEQTDTDDTYNAEDVGSVIYNVVPTHDREGFPITVPEQIETIIAIGPSNTEILVALGFGDAIIQADRHSADVPGIQPGISTFDIRALDIEYIIDLNPDIIFITGMARTGGDDDPLRQVSAVGITVIYMPSSASIPDIKEDIRFMAAVLGATAEGEEIVEYMTAELDRIREIGETITERRTVYFEISPAPHMFSFGSGTFLNEMIELVGAINVFADKEGWVQISDEALIDINPDVILTSISFLDDPIGEIMDRPGWGAITAVQNGDVFMIDTASSNRPNHNIIRALREIAAAVYPDKF